MKSSLPPGKAHPSVLSSDYGEGHLNSIFLSCPSLLTIVPSFRLYVWNRTRYYQGPSCGLENDLEDTPKLLQAVWPSQRSSPSVFTCNSNSSRPQRQCISAKIIEHNWRLKQKLISFQGSANENKNVILFLSLQIYKDWWHLMLARMWGKRHS